MKIHLRIKKAIFLTLLAFISLQSFAQTDSIFWFVAPAVSKNHGDGPVYIRLANPDPVNPVTVTFSMPASSPDPIAAFPAIQTVTIPAGSAVSVNLTPLLSQTTATRNALEQDSLGDQVENLGIKIQSSGGDFTAYYENLGNRTRLSPGDNQELMALKGQNAFGTEFYTPFQTWMQTGHPPFYGNTTFSSIDIIAVDPGITTVTITPTQDVKNYVSPGVYTIHPAGTPYTVTLSQGQTYSAVANSTAPGAHLNGTIVTTNSPTQRIVVQTKDDSVKMQNFENSVTPSLNDDYNYDLIVDQIIPTNITGNEYIVVRGNLKGRENAQIVTGPTQDFDIAIIVATEDNTAIYKDGVQVLDNSGNPLVLDKGQSDTIHVHSESAYITSSPSGGSGSNFYVEHISGFDYELSGTVLPPIVCTGSKSVSFVRSNGPPSVFYLNLLIPTGAESGFIIGGTSYDMTPIANVVPGTNGLWKSVHFPYDANVGSATTIVNSIAPFHVGIINGLQNKTSSYGYFSDFNRVKNNLVTPGPVCWNQEYTFRANKGFNKYLWFSDPGRTDTLYKSNDPNDDGYTVTKNADATYYVTVYSGNCPLPASFTIDYTDPINLVLSAKDTICSTENYTITVPTPNIQSYLWKYSPNKANPSFSNMGPGDTTATINVNQSGYYKVNVLSNLECPAADSVYIIVEEPEDIIFSLSTDGICPGVTTDPIGPVSPNQNNYQYVWANTPGGLSDPDIQNPTATPGVSPLADTIIVYSLQVTDPGSGCVKDTTVGVRVFARPTASVAPTSICPGDPATLTAVTNATGTIAYLWKEDGTGNTVGGNSSTLTVNPTTDATYTVTIVNSNNCSRDASGTVSINSKPPVTLADVPVCLGANATLSATSSATNVLYEYYLKGNPTKLADGQTYMVTSPSSNEEYVVKVISGTSGNCSNTDTATVIVNPLPLATPVGATICSGDNALISISTTSSNPGYSWIPNGETTSSITVNPTSDTDYSVRVTDLTTTCSLQFTVPVKVNVPPAATPVNGAICEGDTVVISIGTNASNPDYSWTGRPEKTSSITVNPTVDTNYPVTVKDIATNCSTPAIVSVTVRDRPTATVSPATICVGQTANISASTDAPNATYSWSSGESSQGISVSPASTQTYAVTVTHGTNNCKNIGLGVVTVNALPTVTVNAPGTCEGTSTTVGVSSNASNPTYVWSDGVTGQSRTVSPTSDQTYTVTVTDGTTSCQNTGQGTVDVGPKPLASVNSDRICLGSTFRLVATSATSGLSYNWSTGGTQSFIDIAPSDTGQHSYSVVVDLNGCKSDPTLGIVHVVSKPFISFPSKATTTCFYDNGPLSLNAPGTYTKYEWSTGETTQNIQVNQEGEYILTVFNNYGMCPASDRMKINQECPPSLFVPKAFTPNGDGVNDSLEVFCSFVKDVEVIIFNRWGEVVFKVEEKDKPIMTTHDKGHPVWDGNYRDSKDPIETFPYIVYYRSLNSNDKKKYTVRGSVTVVR